MDTDRSPRPNSYAHPMAIFAVVILVTLCAMFLLDTAIGPPDNVFTYNEIVIVPLASAEEVFSEQVYSGVVYLRISGTGHISPEIISDGFCPYDLAGDIFRDNTLHDYGIAVDGHVRLFTAGSAVHWYLGSRTWCMVEDHTYFLGYSLDEQPRRLSFRSVDTSIEDNSGAFEVGISIEHPPEIILKR